MSMVKAIDKGQVEGNGAAHPRDWRKSMSDNVALALLVYTALQIFITVHAMAKGMNSITPYVLLVMLVAGIIPFCRKYEHRWTRLSDEQAVNPALAEAFRRDQIALWLLAITTPLALTGFFMLIFS
jgi:hypothetical protein